MANAFTDYAANRLIDALLRSQSITFPTTLWVSLHTSTAPASANEVTGGSYARQSYTSNLTNWAGTQGAGTTAASSGTSKQSSNNVLITFPQPTANWGNVQGIGLFDAQTNGNLWLVGTLLAAKNIVAADLPPQIRIGTLTFRFV